MAKPLVAVVGRPNVGKSTFFNKIARRRISIVEDTPGVTRDRIYADCEWLNHKFTLIDTGGIEPHTDDILLRQMRRQAEVAIDTCDVILFFTDGRTGKVQVAVRPEHITLNAPQPGKLEGEIKIFTFLGDYINYEVQLANGQVIQANQYLNQKTGFHQKGEKVSIEFSTMNVFDAEGKEALL